MCQLDLIDKIDTQVAQAYQCFTNLSRFLLAVDMSARFIREPVKPQRRYHASPIAMAAGRFVIEILEFADQAVDVALGIAGFY